MRVVFSSTVFFFMISTQLLLVESMPGKLKHPEDAEFLSDSLLKQLHQHILKIDHIANLNISELPKETLQAILSPEMVQALPAESLPKIEHNTTFFYDLGGWVIFGEWARYHLPLFNTTPPVPLVPRSTDQHILLFHRNFSQPTQVVDFPSTLSKTVPGMTNGKISMEHYAQFTHNMSLEGTLVCDNKTETLFNLTTSDLQQNHSKWVNSTFPIPPHLHNMTITIRPKGNGALIWAVNSINITGIRASPNSPEFQTTVKPEVITSTPSSVQVTVTNATVASRANVSTIPPANGTTNANGTGGVTTQSPTTKLGTADKISSNAAAVKEDPLKEIHGIATAIWDAFYVFLALFCACLIALVVMIFRQR